MMSSKKTPISKIKVLYVSRLNKGSTGFGYLEGFKNLGLIVKEVDTSKWLGNWELPFWERVSYKIRRGRLPQELIVNMNNAIIEAADEVHPHFTFFMGAPFILPETLKHTQRYGLNFCHFQDDMFNPNCRTYTFFDSLPYWDTVFVTRQVNIKEYEALGVRAVFVRKAYTPGLYRPVIPSATESEKYKGDVVFIGSFNSPSRADFLAEIIHACPDVKFNIWGGGWERLKRPYYWINKRRWRTWPHLIRATHPYPLWYDEMSKAMNSHKIVLGLLNHYNRDLHTSRTLEIPACGGFMLAERTSEHLEMFEEGTEAEYFSTWQEAVQKIKYYLAHDEERQAIARRGHERCMVSDYSYYDRAKTVLEYYHKLKE